MALPVRNIEISTLKLYRRGKVRDTFELGDHLLMVATDRISAFDVVLPDGIPDKGRILTLLSIFWFQQTSDIVPSHFISGDVADLPGDLEPYREVLRDRFMIVKRADRLDIECVVRGYLAGSAWVEYQHDGTVCGQRLPSGLVESQRLPEPIFTPATKAEQGHDLNVSIGEMEKIAGTKLTRAIIEKSFELFDYASRTVSERGIILADSKFEFGLIDGRLTLIDEALTPDSSRYWDARTYAPGRSQESFDKQYVRDWLLESGWDRNPPAPPLPDWVVAGTARRYREAFERITGRALAE
jgi:phosphoribosylaminoimidazole-succinocarboxamide synthase